MCWEKNKYAPRKTTKGVSLTSTTIACPHHHHKQWNLTHFRCCLACTFNYVPVSRYRNCLTENYCCGISLRVNKLSTFNAMWNRSHYRSTSCSACYAGLSFRYKNFIFKLGQMMMARALMGSFECTRRHDLWVITESPFDESDFDALRSCFW